MWGVKGYLILLSLNEMLKEFKVFCLNYNEKIYRDSLVFVPVIRARDVK